MQYVLPLMLTVMCARFIGNIFNDGLYDIQIHTRQLSFLDEDESKIIENVLIQTIKLVIFYVYIFVGVSKLIELHDLMVNEIMTKDPITLPPVVHVGQVFDIMKDSHHHCYPVGNI